MTIFADRTNREPHCGTEFFEMLANLVHGDATLFGGVLATVQSRVDLFAKNSFEPAGPGFARIQMESQGVFYVRARRTLL